MDFSLLSEQFLDTYGLAAVFGIMFLKELGIPVPIPADLIMLGAAARAASGRFPLAAAFLAIFTPMLAGGLVQYSIARGPGRQMIYRLGRIVGLTQERLDRAMGTVRRGGAVAVAVGLTTPGIRIAIVPASGLADLRVGAFVPGLVAGSATFLAWHFAIGYLAGGLFALSKLPTPVILSLAIGIFVLGIVGWLVIHNRARGRGRPAPGNFGTWAEAACPACLAIALLEEKQATHSTHPILQ